MQTKTVPDKPQFLCGRCRDVLCNDCASIAAEYEYLHDSRALSLQRAESELQDARREIEILKQSVENWKLAAKAGYPLVIQEWMDGEMEKARTAGRDAARKEARESGLLDAIARAEKLLSEIKIGG